MAKVPTIASFVQDIKTKGGNWIIPLVVYDLPNRDCAALASNGEFSVAEGGREKYQAYIRAIKQQITQAGSQKFVIVYGMS